MNVEALDEFFAATIAGPETVMPSEYYFRLVTRPTTSKNGQRRCTMKPTKHCLQGCAAVACSTPTKRRSAFEAMTDSCGCLRTWKKLPTSTQTYLKF